MGKTNKSESNTQRACCECGCKTNESYLYRNLRGKGVFTGFIERPEGLFWIGKDEKSPPLRIEPTTYGFFMNEMKQYDPV